MNNISDAADALNSLANAPMAPSAIGPAPASSKQPSAPPANSASKPPAQSQPAPRSNMTVTDSNGNIVELNEGRMSIGPRISLNKKF